MTLHFTCCGVPSTPRYGRCRSHQGLRLQVCVRNRFKWLRVADETYAGTVVAWVRSHSEPRNNSVCASLISTVSSAQCGLATRTCPMRPGCTCDAEKSLLDSSASCLCLDSLGLQHKPSSSSQLHPELRASLLSWHVLRTMTWHVHVSSSHVRSASLSTAQRPS